MIRTLACGSRRIVTIDALGSAGEGWRPNFGEFCLRSSFLSCLLLAAAPAHAAEDERGVESASQAGAQEDEQAIVVIATRLKGQVETDVPPVMSLDAADIAAYGAGSLGELVAAVSPQAGSGRGRGEGHPVILLNGQRISGFRQLREIPPEAIRRMEVLPEEVALRFGFAPNQRVINFIMKDDFSSVTASGEYNVPTRGGFAESELEAGLVRFDGPRRLNLKAKLEDASLLTEAEGGVKPAAGAPDQSAFRSLLPDSATRTLNGSWSTGLGEGGLGGSFTVDGEVSRSDARSLSGLDTATPAVPGAVVRNVRMDKAEGGLTLNKRVGDWQLTATADAAHTDTWTRTARAAGGDEARNRLLTISTYAGLSGNLFDLPAGPVSATLDAGFDLLDNRNADTLRSEGSSRLSRRIGSAGLNVGLPIAGGQHKVLAGLGDLSLNFSGDLHHFSEFGTLTDWSAGLVWSPLPRLTLSASHIRSEVAPSVGQLGNPRIATFNVPVQDFTRGEAALVTVLTGGNPDLRAERQRDVKISANYEFPFLSNSSLLAEYFRNRSSDVTRAFPLLTPATEATFPDRVTRDGAGRLIAIDSRPVTFAQVETEHLRWGVNLSGRIGKEGGHGAGRGTGMPGFGRGGPPGNRWNLSVYHIWRFADRVRIAPGGPVLDQLSGDSLADGGVPRHALELEGGLFLKGFGVRFNGSWKAPAQVLASGGPGSTDLRFGSVARLDARLFVNFDRKPGAVEAMPWLKGVRVAFDFKNVLDSRQKVTDGNGVLPFAYQRAFRDPRGRFAGIDIRKTF